MNAIERQANRERYKLERLLEKEGVEYTFFRYKANSRGERREELGIEEEVVITAVYHESRSYVNVIVGDDASTKDKFSPMMLCKVEDAMNVIQQEDLVNFSGRSFKVNDVHDIANMHVYGDISLELILTEDGVENGI